MHYPNEVEAIIGIDESIPNQTKINKDPEWIPLHEEIISNTEIQKIETLSGTHYLHWTNADKISDMTKEFIDTYIK